MNDTPEMVYVLDDDPEMVKALTRLLRAKRFQVRGYTSATAFLAEFCSEHIACLVLDVAMPELDGLELQRRLAQRGFLIPIVFVTAHGDIPTSVRAIKAGATDFLTKPIDAASLVHAVRSALHVARSRHRTIAETAALASRLAGLTAREREVMQHVVVGRLNKQIAADFGTSEQNIKQHRSNLMRKMGVESVAELVRAAEKLGLGSPER